MKRQYVKRGLARLLLIAMLIGMVPGGTIWAQTESEDVRGTVSSDITARVSALVEGIKSMDDPTFTHNTYEPLYDKDASGNRIELPHNYASTYFFVHEASDGKLYVLCPTAQNNKLKVMEVSSDGDNQHISGVDLSHAFTLVKVGNTDYKSFLFKAQNGERINFTHDSTTGNVSTYMGSQGHVFALFMDDNALNIDLYLDLDSDSATAKVTHFLSWSNEGAVFKAKDTVTTEKMWKLYKTVTMDGLSELYREIQNAAALLTVPYDGTLYTAFLDTLEDSITYYNANNTYHDKALSEIASLNYDLKEQSRQLQKAVTDATEALSVETQASLILGELTKLSQPGTYNKLVDITQTKIEDLDNRKVGKTAMNAMMGPGYLATLYNGYYYLMSLDGTRTNVIGTEITVSENSVVGASPEHLLSLLSGGTNTGYATTYYIAFLDENNTYSLYIDRALNSDGKTYRQEPLTTTTVEADGRHWGYSVDGRRLFINNGKYNIRFNGAQFE